MTTIHTARSSWPLMFASCTAISALAAMPIVATAQQSEGLEEIVVTARRAQVDLQKAPVAVSVVSGQDFDESNVARLDNFNGYTPSLTVAKNDGAGRVVAIRGVGWETAQNLSTQPSVLVYMDGVYVANPLSMGTDLGELERVEVFRGPQGTEFGQGTTGGAINLVMKAPDPSAMSGGVQLGYGTYNNVRARGAINVPLADTVALRASVQKYQHDGFAEITGGALNGYDLDDADSLTGTLALLWKPADTFSVKLSAFGLDSDQHAAAQKNVNDPVRDPRKLSQDYPGIFKLKNGVYSAVVQWDTPWGFTFKSLTGEQRLRKQQSEDGDRLTEALTSVDILGFFSPWNWDVLPFWDNNSDAFSQEFNLLHKGTTVDWTAGAYYLNHENFNYFLEASFGSPYSAWVDALANPSPATLPPFASALNFVEARTVTRNDEAAYAQLTFHVTDRVNLTAGGRYQDERQKDESQQFFNCLGAVPCPTVQRTNDHKFTWKAGIDFNLTDKHLLYGLVSTGWKNGGTNPGAVNGAVQVPVVYKPEEVTSFEVGSKNLLANDRIRFNVVGFYYDYKNLQFMQEDPTPFAGGTGNIPKTDIYGIETEFDWLISDAWRIDGNLAWNDGRFTKDFFTLDVVDFREALAPGVGLFTAGGAAVRLALSQTTNLKGNTPPKLVDFSARVGLTNKHVFGGGDTLTSRLDFIHRGEFQYRVFNNPLVDTVPAYDIANLFVTYKPSGSKFDFSLSVTNLFDKAGVNSRFSNPFAMLTTSEEFIPPREVIGYVNFTF